MGRLTRWAPLTGIVAIGIALSVAAFGYARDVDFDRVFDALQRRAETRAHGFERTLFVAAGDAKAVAVYLAAEPAVNAAHFHKFARLAHGAEDLDSAVTWYPWVAGSDRAAFVAAARLDGNPDYEIRELTPDNRFVPAPERNAYLPALYEESYDNAPGVAGFDLLFRPERRALVERVRDEGNPLATPPFQMLLSGQRGLGFIFLLPVYSTGLVPPTVGERRAAFRGLTVARFRFDSLLPGMIADTPGIRAAIDIRVGSPGQPAQPVAAFDPATRSFAIGASLAPMANGGITVTREFTVQGQHWILISRYTAEIINQSRSITPWAWPAIGLLGTGVLASYVGGQNRRRAARALGESEMRLRQFIDQAPAGIVMLDRDMCYLSASRRFHEDVGLVDQDFTGRSHYEILPEAESWREFHSRALAGEVINLDCEPLRRLDGTIDWIKAELRPWFDDTGSIGGIIFYREVINDRVSAETTLRASERRFQDIAEVSGDWIWETDQEHRFTRQRITLHLAREPLSAIPHNTAML